ncbi:MAG: HAD-IC family P-type ATPase [Planctomycetes bacterium]|nr:HAD-IC family P-type ATPase [Planctomycetota bacterium]
MDIDRGPTAWHAETLEAVLARLDSSPVGLGAEEARRRRAEVGPNSLTTEEGAGPLALLARQIHNPLIYLLLGAAALSLAAGKTVDAGVIAGVVVLNTVLGFVQEWRAEGALAALRHLAAPHARALRGGDAETVEAADVVPGDVLVLETGDRVAADARLLEGGDLRVDESALTGEAEPAAKRPGRLEASTPLGDRTNMVWMSTVVTAGRGRAAVVETGMRTEMGAIAGEVRRAEREATPLQQRMGRLSIAMGVLGIALAAVVFVLGVLRGYRTLEMLLFAVAVAVSAIPEGLPAVITVTLALGVRRMAEHHAIIRRLPAVETLGSTTVICSDKTGTITANQMTVRRIWAGGHSYTVGGEGYDPQGEIRDDDGGTVGTPPGALERLLRIGATANNARVRRDDGRWRVEGSPSEGALLVAAAKAGMDPDAIRRDVPRLAEVPFSSDRKFMATLHDDGDQGRIALVKGAPDRILGFASHVLIDGEEAALDDPRRRQVGRLNEQLAGDALRVIAGAYRRFPAGKETLDEADVREHLTLAGLWGMMDPPREQSAPAVAAAKEAGIRPVLITGDHAATALAIARRIGIAVGDEVLTAGDVEMMDSDGLAAATLKSGVFARVSPAHKLTITNALKANGQIVAMTGDGVNDAPALKGADIGVAMGRGGTEVAKEAADMVLTDDNFATIVRAVEEGRTIYANLRRVVFFLLATNLGEVLTLAGALLLGLDLPLTAVMILWVNLVTDGACTVPLGVEPRHWDVLKQPPRDPDEPIVHRVMLRRMAMLTPLMAIGTLGLFSLCHRRTGDLAYARTVAFTALVASQWFQAVNARSQFQSVFSIGPLTNRWLLLGVGLAVALQVLIVQTALGAWLFGTRPLAAADWLWIVLVAATIWIADELLKQLGVHGKRPR